jgi:antitoxin VapB
VWLRRTSSFAWATDGAASWVHVGDTEGVASVVVTRDDAWIVTDTIEAPRLEREEGLGAASWRMHVRAWHEPETLPPGVEGPVGCDVEHAGCADVSADVRRLRSRLTPSDVERLRTCAHLCAEVMGAVMCAVRPGDSENEIAGRLSMECRRRGVLDVVNLVAADERIDAARHPLPTGRRLERRAMAVLCGRRRGVIAALTRFVHFGGMGDELRRRFDAVARIDASMIAASRPGHGLAGVLGTAIDGYAHAGFAGEWRLHHQGGTIGYEPRETVATPDCAEALDEGMACAWNPSITGTKSEDTILVTGGAPEVLTAIADWPSMDTPQGVHRPAPLERRR